MYLKTLCLKNFRNHRDLKLCFDQRANIIYGDNGVGKTNVLEALFLLSTGKSFRTTHLQELINKEASYFFIEAHIVKEDVMQSLSIGYDGKKKKIDYNYTQLPSFSSLLGILPSVLYAPKDIALICGSPQERRTFLNINISQIDPLYLHHLQRYIKCLDSRNALLKNQTQNPLEYKAFEIPLSHSAAYISKKREDYLLDLENKLQVSLKRLSVKNELCQIKYKPSIRSLETPLAHYFEKKLESNREKEKVLKTTLIGPHRDDFELLFNTQEAKSFCSEGQKRTLLTGLKLAEWEILFSTQKECPILCVDDFGIHLDTTRHELLQDYLKNFGQIFVTSTYEILENQLNLPKKIFHFKD